MHQGQLISRLDGDLLCIELHLPPAVSDARLCELEEAAFAAVHEAGVSAVVLDLAHVPFISSRALGMLLSLRKRLIGQHRTLVLTSLQEEVTRLLHITRLTSLFAIGAAADGADARHARLQTA